MDILIDANNSYARKGSLGQNDFGAISKYTLRCPERSFAA